MIVFAGITPHPPILLPFIGKGEEKKILKTREAFEKFAKDFNESEPDTAIFISPHMVHYPHMFNVLGMDSLYGSFENFGTKEFEWHGRSNLELAKEIVDKSEDEGLPAILYDNGEGEYELDHGVMVPLYHLLKNADFSFRVLPIGYSIASRAEHYSFGQVLSDICDRRRAERIAIIASGDLSHRLKESSPAGIEYRAKEFDEKFVEAVKGGDDYSIMNMDPDLVESAGECGYRSVLVLLGALSDRQVKPEVYSYEGPFGVGYMVANMNVK